MRLWRRGYIYIIVIVIVIVIIIVIVFVLVRFVGFGSLWFVLLPAGFTAPAPGLHLLTGAAEGETGGAS